MIDFEAIEDGIVAALQADATIVAYAGHIGPWQGSPEQARQAGQVLKYPSITVVYTGGELDPKGQFTFGHEAKFQVTVTARNLRSRRAQRASDASGEVGSYNVLADVLRVLSGQDLGLDMDELRPQTIEPLEPDATNESRYGVVFQTRVLFDMDDENSQTGTENLVEIRAAHSVLNDETGDQVTVVTDIHEVGP